MRSPPGRAAARGRRCAGRAGRTPAAAAAGAAESLSAQAGRYHRGFLICLIFCLILCSASLAWLNKAPGYTGLNRTLGWVVGLSVAGVFLSLLLLVLSLSRRSARQVVWAFVPMLSLSFLTFAPFVQVAVIRRQARDWAVLAAYLAAVAAEIVLASAGYQGSTAWSISYVMIPLVAGAAAIHALMRRRLAPASSPAPNGPTAPR